MGFRVREGGSGAGCGKRGYRQYGRWEPLIRQAADVSKQGLEGATARSRTKD